MNWPPDYVGELIRRQKLYSALSGDKKLLSGASEMYKTDLVVFVNDMLWVSEPRNASKGEPVKVPVVPFPRQVDYLEWMVSSYHDQKSGAVEKSRDSGATWMASAFAVWLWLFHPGAVTGFGSRKENLVDRKGDMQSIFEKVRSLVDNLPAFMLPDDFSWNSHSNYMRLVNPENGASIIGEAGDNIGRGGRSSIYFVDEAAHITRPDVVEAALTATTDVRIDISSPLVGTLFNENIRTSDNVFVFDVRDVPWHTNEWIEGKKQELEKKGLGHIFKQEYLRDSTAGVEGQLISSDMIDAAIGAFEKLGIRATGARIASLDVADGGADKNALSVRHGGEIKQCRIVNADTAGDAGIIAHRDATTARCQKLIYDSIGVGAGVAAATKNLAGLTVVGWAASEGVYIPRAMYEGNRRNEDMFVNAKAQNWWGIRDRFAATKAAIDGEPYDIDDLISISTECTDIRDLKTELAQIRYKHNANGKIIIQKTPDGHRSPNLAEAVMIGFAPSQMGFAPKARDKKANRDMYRDKYASSSGENWKTA